MWWQVLREKQCQQKESTIARGMLIAILYREVREGLADNMTFEQIKNNL